MTFELPSDVKVTTSPVTVPFAPRWVVRMWAVAALGAIVVGLVWAWTLKFGQDGPVANVSQIISSPVFGLLEDHIEPVAKAHDKWNDLIRVAVAVALALSLVGAVTWLLLAWRLARGSARARAIATFLVVPGTIALVLPGVWVCLVPVMIGVSLAWVPSTTRHVGREPVLVRRTTTTLTSAGTTAVEVTGVGVTRVRDLAERHDVVDRTRGAASAAATVAVVGTVSAVAKGRDLAERHDVRGRTSRLGRRSAAVAGATSRRLAERARSAATPPAPSPPSPPDEPMA